MAAKPQRVYHKEVAMNNIPHTAGAFIRLASLILPLASAALFDFAAAVEMSIAPGAGPLTGGNSFTIVVDFGPNGGPRGDGWTIEQVLTFGEKRVVPDLILYNYSYGFWTGKISIHGTAPAAASAGTVKVRFTIDHFSGSFHAETTYRYGDVATLLLTSLEHTYDGTPKEINVKTEPPGLSVITTYDGNQDPPIGAGVYEVHSRVVDSRFFGEVRDTLTIDKALCPVTLGNADSVTSFPYDGSPKEISVATDPPNLDVLITYDASSQPPSAIGTYTVEASVQDPNYSGMATTTMTIGPAMSVFKLNGRLFYARVGRDKMRLVVDLVNLGELPRTPTSFGNAQVFSLPIDFELPRTSTNANEP